MESNDSPETQTGGRHQTSPASLPDEHQGAPSLETVTGTARRVRTIDWAPQNNTTELHMWNCDRNHQRGKDERLGATRQHYGAPNVEL